MTTTEPARTVRQRLRSKLSPPTLHATQVRREALLQRIVDDGARVVLCQAPAGFGKSTLLAQCQQRYQQQGTATAWLTLDDADNDIQRFLTCIEAAATSLIGPAEAPLDDAQADQSAGDTALHLFGRLSGEHRAFSLFLDDFERLHEPGVLTLVREIIDHLPPNCRLLIGSRGAPNIGLARWRARGQLLELGVEALRFSPQETGAFLNDQRHLALPAASLDRIQTRTEGWVAALWLAALALDHHPTPECFVTRFSGENKAVADYLAEDVLARQPRPVQLFLLRTSVLRYLNVELCNALMPDSDNEALLTRLENASVFLMPIEGQHRVYRYHSLFADFLRQQLQRQLPGEIAALHHAASSWFEAQKRPVPAIDHALEGGAIDRALELMNLHAENLLSQGRMRLLERWFRALPEEQLATQPLLQTIHVWALCFTRSPREAMALLQRSGLEQSTDPRIRHHVLAVRLMVLGIMDSFEQAYKLGRQALKPLPEGEPFADTTLVNLVAHAYSVMGRHKQARQLLDDARDAAGHRGGAFNAMYSEGIEGIIDLQEGRQRQAAARFRLAARMSRHQLPANGANSNAWAGVLQAVAAYEGNDLAAATRFLNLYAPQARDIGLPDHMILADTLLSRIAFENGDLDKAFQILAELEMTGHQRQLPRVVVSARLQRAHLMLLQGDDQASLAELRRADDPAVRKRMKTLRLVANDLLTVAIGWWRQESLIGDPLQAAEQLTVAIAEAQAQNRHRRALKLRLLHAVALQRRGALREAFDELEAVLRIGWREDYQRLILDEGPRIGALVVRLQTDALGRQLDQREPLFAEYLQTLLHGFGPAVFNTPPDPGADTLLVEPLTRKETRVLKLLAEGLSNSAMAERLFVSDSTVRTHLRNINAKLNASNRTEAVAIARKAGVV